MHASLKKIEDEWRRNPENEDVKAEPWQQGEEQVEKCPEGCELKILEWDRISGYDAECETRVCYEHGFVRIYVRTGSTKKASN